MGVVLFTLGGTIAMTRGDEGVVTRLGGVDLVAGVPGTRDVEVRDLHAVPSANLSFTHLLDVVDAASAAVADGATGVVLTQGTDTLEETAFLIDSLWTHDVTLVVTGAMRNPTLPGADGPANLLAAVQVAGSSTCRGLGALVVLDDEIHAARFVRKTHSTSTGTFASPDVGPIGHVVEGIPRVLVRLPRRTAVSGLTRDTLAATRVPLYTATLDDDGALLEAVGAVGAIDGLVVAAFGGGHVQSSLAPVLGGLASRLPVVLTSRTGAGSVLTHTYGADGSETDLLRRGLIGGGFVHPYKARVLLRLLVAAGAGREQIESAFAEIG